MASFEKPQRDLKESVEILNSGRVEYDPEKDLGIGQKLEIITNHNTYTLEKREDGFYISGHPEYCPKPTKAYIHGTTAGGSAIKVGKIVEGGHLEFALPDRGGAIVTSEIDEINLIEEDENQ